MKYRDNMCGSRIYSRWHSLVKTCHSIRISFASCSESWLKHLPMLFNSSRPNLLTSTTHPFRRRNAPTMRLATALLSLVASVAALRGHRADVPSSRHLQLRDVSTCEQAYGFGWTGCSGGNFAGCYNPELGQVCIVLLRWSHGLTECIDMLPNRWWSLPGRILLCPSCRPLLP